MAETKKEKTKPKEKVKSKTKSMDKSKTKSMDKSKTKKKERKVIVEITEPEKEKEIYADKVKHLLYKMKNQNNFNDTGIRFAWRN